MNKSALVGPVSVAAGIDPLAASKAVDAVFAAIAAALVAGDEVRVMGFGVFDVVERSAREGRNPQTGAVIVIPDHPRVTFRVSEVLRDAVRGDQ